MSKRKQIILYLVATLKYHVYVQPLLDSVEKYFLTEHDVSVILFTDDVDKEYSFDGGLLVCVKIPSYKYPEATLLRYKLVSDHRELFEKSDAIYYLDVDMLVVAPITDNILPVDNGLVSIVHPGFYNGGYGSSGTHEKSLAYVPPEKRNGYYCGGFQGGSTKSYLRMAKVLSENIDKDLQTAKEIGYTDNNGILAEWNDESHYNWYLKYGNNYESWNILDPSYCYPESLNIPYEKKILALDKDHKAMRE